MKNKNRLQTFAFVSLITALLMLSVTAFSQSPPAPKEEKLLNGLKVLMWNDARSDKVSVKIRIHAGAAFDPQGKEGTMQLLADDLFPNDASRDFFTEDLGGGLEVITNYDYIQINASCKPESLLTMLETLATALSNPTIDKDTTAKVRAALLARLNVLEADPAYVADQAVAKRLFGTFPYGRPQKGSIASVQKLEFADLIDAKQRFLTADNATMTLSGNFDRNLVFKAIRRYFGGWLKSDKKVPPTFKQPDEPATALLTIPSPKLEVAAMRGALRGVARGGKDFAASQVLTRIISERLKARMATTSVESLVVRNDPHVLPGSIIIGILSSQGTITGVDGKMQHNDMVVSAFSDPITNSEFQAAQSQASTDWAKRISEDFWLDADTFKTVSADGDRVIFDKVTLDDVKNLAARLQKMPIATVLVYSPAK